MSGAGGRVRCGLRPMQCISITAVVILVSVGGLGYFLYRSQYPHRFAAAPVTTQAQVAPTPVAPAPSAPAVPSPLCLDLDHDPRAVECSRANRKLLGPTRPGEELCVVRAHAPNYQWFWIALTTSRLAPMRDQLEGRWEENLVSIMTAIGRQHGCSSGGVGGSGCLYADAGANSGYLSLVAARNGMDTIAIEPLPSNYRILRYSLCMNQVNPITNDCDGDEAGDDCLTQPVPNPDSVSVFARPPPPPPQTPVAFARSSNLGVTGGTGNFQPGRVELLPFVISDSRTTLEISGNSLDGHIANSYNHDEVSEARVRQMTAHEKAKTEKGTPTPAVRLDDWLLGPADATGGGSSGSRKSPKQQKQRRRSASDAGAGASAGAGVAITRRVTILKIDTEGHEPSVIRGASRLFDAGLIDHILLEYNLWRGMTVTQGLEMLYYLDDLGYVCYDLDYPYRVDTGDFLTKYPRVPRDEFESMTTALHQDLPSTLAVDAASNGKMKGYRGRQWAVNLYFTKTLPPSKLLPGISDEPVY